MGAENAIILNRIQAKQDISINNIKNTFFEAFDISQATQTYMYLIMLIRVNKNMRRTIGDGTNKEAN